MSNVKCNSIPRLVPVEHVYQGMSRRWCAEHCRKGSIRGAVKIGAVWFVDVDALPAANDTTRATNDTTSIEDQVRARFRCGGAS